MGSAPVQTQGNAEEAEDARATLGLAGSVRDSHAGAVQESMVQSFEDALNHLIYLKF
jgi:hypothetical protein